MTAVVHSMATLVPMSARMRLDSPMATLLGLLTAVVLLLLAINLLPGLHVEPVWQAALAFLVGVINLVVWRRNRIPPMRIGEAAKSVALVMLVIAAIAAVDTVIGGAFRSDISLTEAFLHSGAAGGPIDIFLFLAGVLVGIPTAVRSVVLFYGGQRS